MSIQFWVSSRMAAEIGCTHHARIFGIIPGFFDPVSNMWVSRSDLLNPLEDLLAFLWVNLRVMRGEEPDFMFSIGREIAR